MSRTTSGARPSEGSSRQSSFGSDIMARPSTSICCSPPESVPAFWPLRSLQPREHVEDAVDHAADLGAVAPVLEAAELEVFARRQERKHMPAFRHQRDAGERALVRGEPRDVLARET